MRSPHESDSQPSPARVRCEHGHVTVVDARAIELTHTADVVVGFRYWCARCGSITEVSAAPTQLALLREFGAIVARDLLKEAAETGIDDPQRQIVSMQILLDDDTLAAFEEVQRMTDPAHGDVQRG